MRFEKAFHWTVLVCLAQRFLHITHQHTAVMGQTLGRHAGDKENQPLDNGEKVTPAGTCLCLTSSPPIRAIRARAEG